MSSNAKGVATAVVVDNDDPQRLCRVKVRYPWHDDPAATHWARLAMPTAAKTHGFAVIPDVGDEVVVAFEREDVRRPFVIGTLWNAADAPPQARASKDAKRGPIDARALCLQDDKGNRVRIDGKTGVVEITSIAKVTIKAPSVSIESSGALDIKAGATLTLRGALINLN